MNTPAPPLLARSARRILQIGLLQGALLLLICLLPDDTGWFPDTAAGRSVWLLAGALAPMALMLLVPRHDERGALPPKLLGLLIVLPSLWLAWWASTQLDAIGFAPIDEPPFALLLILLPTLLLILLPFCQTALQRTPGSCFGAARYAALTRLAWHNAFSLIVSTLLLILGWILLILCMVVSGAEGPDLEGHGSFLAVGHGLVTAVLILLARHPAGPGFILPAVMRGIGMVLLPMLSCLAVALCLALPFIGLEALRAAGMNACLLLGICALTLLAFNAAYGDFCEPPNYHAAGHQLIRFGLLCLPVLTMLALQALWLRIGQYGLSQMRVLGLIATGLIGFHAIGYAIAVLKSARPCAHIIRPVNIIGALLAATLILQLHSPWLDPNRLTVDQHLGRLLRGDIAPEAIDLVHLRFDSATYGWQAIETLAQQLETLPPPTDAGTGAPAATEHTTATGMTGHARLKADSRFMKRLDLIRHTANAWEARAEENRPDPIDDPAALAQHIIVAPGTGPIEADWWQRLLDNRFGIEQCLSPDQQCVLIQKDLIDDERPERLLCLVTKDAWGVDCLLYTLSPGGKNIWHLESTVTYSGMDANIQQIRERLLQGEVPSNRMPNEDDPHQPDRGRTQG
ncbi:MAG: DUF4153 domain-containing protein [Lautropia sp.]|nr:DUF4153 domain-containing protein [Lautropia sp.]